MAAQSTHTPIASWSFTAKAGQPEDLVIEFSLHVTNACISTKFLTELDHTTLILRHEDLSEAEPTFREATLCWLSPNDRSWSAPLNLVFSPGEKIRFEASKNAVDLVGYYFDTAQSKPVPPSAFADPPKSSRKRPHLLENASAGHSSAQQSAMLSAASRSVQEHSTTSVAFVISQRRVSAADTLSQRRIVTSTVEQHTTFDGITGPPSSLPTRSRRSSVSSTRSQNMHLQREGFEQSIIQRREEGHT
ncbi:hypothetical protein SISNIDRAFT_468370 [Sistotremastrum niveocremeum HHB9708]|uniref:Nucleoplasmin-like domain-containing protein n=1 Tax=Sistotremastrum niveocremeum HHB9708 TaxID=1314777 RepID=A0A164RIL7_9AGAM|nr:hypothetical protein SISNIDRAFT_468370 [Sistotremastrum niveocremeum HHB9708]